MQKRTKIFWGNNESAGSINPTEEKWTHFEDKINQRSSCPKHLTKDTK